MREREHPIVMSDRSIQDILTGRKTVTRRVFSGCKAGVRVCWTPDGHIVLIAKGMTLNGICPHGSPNDLLWVKERYVNDKGETVPAMFMPKKMARIWLKIVDVTIDTLGAMTDEDAIAEGYRNVEEYKNEWNRLNAKRGYPWKNDLPVWVITFTKFDKENENGRTDLGY